LTTKGLGPNPLVFGDLNGRQFANGFDGEVTNFDLTAEFTLFEIRRSEELSDAVTNGYITLTETGTPIGTSLVTYTPAVPDDWQSPAPENASEALDFLAAARRGEEAFFLEARGSLGSGGGWADTGTIFDLPVILFSKTIDERATYVFYALSRVLLDAVDPIVAFLPYTSSVAPSVGLDNVRWQLKAWYLGVGEALGGTPAETLVLDQPLDVYAADTRQELLQFTLDRTKISPADVIQFSLSRLSSAVEDTYDGEVAIGQAGILVETLNHNPGA
jgi:hypothetical protein